MALFCFFGGNMIDMDFIEGILKRFESRQLVAYIPCKDRNFTGLNDRASCGPVLGVSGVTVGTGLDLGQQSVDGLKEMGIPSAILTKLVPYVGLRKESAAEKLADTPLTLSDSEVDAIDACVHAEYVRRVEALYNKHSSVPFAECPKQAQAVITSVFYQLGAYSGNPGYRTLWKYLTAQEWKLAAAELMNGFKRYPSRRREEGKILLEVC